MTRSALYPRLAVPTRETRAARARLEGARTLAALRLAAVLFALGLVDAACGPRVEVSPRSESVVAEVFERGCGSAAAAPAAPPPEPPRRTPPVVAMCR